MDMGIDMGALFSLPRVHCVCCSLTFVEGWPKNPAKYWRLREAGLFPVQPYPHWGSNPGLATAQARLLPASVSD